MLILVTGGSGYLGGFIVAEALAAGDTVLHLSRRAPADGAPWLAFDLARPPPELPPADALVHAAFDHVPGRYRGGEGDDPEGFLARNREGSDALFAAARAAGVRRLVFLSSRAVYGPHPAGKRLTEDLELAPDTLYGAMKAAVEARLAARAGTKTCAVSLRITGVYGQARPGGWHKWAELFAEAAAGRRPSPRRGTEVHGADMAAAVRLALTAPTETVSGRAFNVSDLDLDRADLLAALAETWEQPLPLPERGAGGNVMDCRALAQLGWRPGGWTRLRSFLAALPRP